jgi:flagellar M-ring protein FliF
VGVAVELDHSSAEIRSRQIDGDGAVPVSEEINEATTEKTDAGGAPGVDANLPERTEAGGAGSTGTQSSEKLRNRVNYDFPTVEKTEVRAPGDIARVSVAVVINQARVQAILAEFGDGAPTVEEFQQQIRESVQAAVGYDQARGDVVSVNFTPFATLELVEDTPAFAAAELGSYLPHALAALAMLLTFVMVVRPLIQKITSVEINRDEEDDDDEVRARQMAEDRNLAERLRDLVDNFEPVDADDLNRLVDHQSDAAAQVLRDWAHNKKAG